MLTTAKVLTPYGKLLYFSHLKNLLQINIDFMRYPMCFQKQSIWHSMIKPFIFIYIFPGQYWLVHSITQSLLGKEVGCAESFTALSKNEFAKSCQRMKTSRLGSGGQHKPSTGCPGFTHKVDLPHESKTFVL